MAPTSENIRLLCDPALVGTANMARDEALLLGVGDGLSPPTLRLYQWNEPTISLGYFQQYDAVLELDDPIRSLPVVRRMTGGGAILHDYELTYSIIFATSDPAINGAPNRLYELMHRAITRSLADVGTQANACGETDDSSAGRGPFFCFARRHKYDLLFGRDKIVGSAQRRTRQAVLQHGSIVVGNRFAQQPTASIPGATATTIGQMIESLPGLVGLELGRTVEQGDWTDSELGAAESLIPKYAGNEWTRRV